MTGYRIVERRNVNAVHALFDSWERADRHLREVIPEHVARGYLADKSLRPEDFVIVASRDRWGK